MRQMMGFSDHREIPPEVVARGKSLYSVSCSFCHGSDARGGSIGPNLLRSDVVLQDQNGELIAPIVHGSRVEKGMPAIELTDAQVADIAGFLHSQKVAGRDFANRDPINIVVGDATAGKATYGRICASCHAEAKDFKYLIDAIPDPRTLQQAWLLPGSPGNLGYGGPPSKYPGSKVPSVTVTVTVDGRATTGTLERIDDFYVALKTPDGATRSFERVGDVPKVEIHDPVHAHREMFRTIKDSEIHDITAYLVTLK
jgi:cytochrome c oxidase cbb3-type subunit III